jgi:hypothetical protein
MAMAPFLTALVAVRNVFGPVIQQVNPRARVARGTGAGAPLITATPVEVAPAELYAINYPLTDTVTTGTALQTRVGAEKVVYQVNAFIVDYDDSDDEHLRLTLSSGLSGSNDNFTRDDDSIIIARIPKQAKYPATEKIGAYASLYAAVGKAYTDAKALIGTKTTSQISEAPINVIVKGMGMYTIVNKTSVSTILPTNLHDLTRGDLEAAAFELSPVFSIVAA